LVHGLLDTPEVFQKLRHEIGDRRLDLLIPHLSLRLGRTPIEEAAAELAAHIDAAYPGQAPLNLLGFSIGGVIARTWIQRLGGHRRTRRFISLGSPQQGTLTAQPWPGQIFKGLADLKWDSVLLRELNSNSELLESVDCHSFYSALDLAVLPGWRAVPPAGPGQLPPLHEQAKQPSQSQTAITKPSSRCHTQTSSPRTGRETAMKVASRITRLAKGTGQKWLNMN
jgi:triacylglycerol lipase